MSTLSFHTTMDQQVDWVPQDRDYFDGKIVEERKLIYRFFLHQHPYVRQLTKRLLDKGLKGLQDADTPPFSSDKPRLHQKFFQDVYNPAPAPADNATTGVYVDKPHPVKDLDFTSMGAYSVYNWELFFHIPFAVAVHLSKNQRFEEAMRWFHFIFDPTDDSDGPTPERYWKVLPFQTTDVQRLEEILVNLATNTDEGLREDTINSINAWKATPFRPHLIARYRPTSYMYKTIMAYLDNLIAWGDSLFRQDNGEAINEAFQLYVLAANILGERPQATPKKVSVRPQTYANFRHDLQAFGTVLTQAETEIGFDTTSFPGDVNEKANGLQAIASIGRALYFCVPKNDKLLSYWDTVADRLFKIRNSLNIQGVFRQLPLFEPPIDPALLVRAAAAGLDVGAIVNGLNQPLPLVRFQVLVQKATEICQEVKSLGNNILSAMEKEDNEALAILRAKHDTILLKLGETVRYGQLQEAVKNREGIEKSFTNVVQRYLYYEKMLGKQESEVDIPELEGLDKVSIEKMKFKMGEPEMALRSIKADIINEIGVEIAGLELKIDVSGLNINKYESFDLLLSSLAQLPQLAANASDVLGGMFSIIPTFSVNLKPIGIGPSISMGGSNLAGMASAASAAFRGAADVLNFGANMSSKVGSYVRRTQDWALQSNLAAGELTQTYKQLRAAQIREAVAELEWKNHQQQIRHAQEIEQFLTDEKDGKKTNQAFYAWMKREVKGLYGQAFQFAFDIAKKAERALQHELGDPSLSYLQFGHLAGKEGLFAGEKLWMDIKRMEMAYLDLNQREYELTKHVSLLQVNPLALVQLRSTGSCVVSLPEELFDMDGPGHYFRRIKTVSVSIPCVAGPYTSVNCTLTLQKSTIRKSSLLRDNNYAAEGAEDDRFSENFGSLQSIVTSNAQNDSGLFETNLHDERYLPFEGSGVISKWLLELPSGLPQFNYNTISDVILHIRYTARQGGALLRKAASENLKTWIGEGPTTGSIRLFSIRHEFPMAWSRFKSMTIDAGNPTAALTLELKEEHYPFWSKGIVETLHRVDFFAKTSTNVVISDENRHSDNLTKDTRYGDSLRAGGLTTIPLPSYKGEFTLKFDNNKMEELWMAVTWGRQQQ